MWTEELNGASKGMDWKSISASTANETIAEPVTKNRLPKMIRQIPEYYFLPRRSIFLAIVLYCSFIAAGVGAGMQAEIWINKRVKGNGGIIWEFNNKPSMTIERHWDGRKCFV